jgi:uncharacterized membrane protein
MAKAVPIFASLGLALLGYAVARRTRARRSRQRTSSAAAGRDERLIGARRFARRGDEDESGEDTAYVGL